MSDVDATQIPAPLCPVCGSPTRLKRRYKAAKLEGDTCVFKCTICGVEYPTHMPALPPGAPRTRA
jgi:hypothetical protein